MRRGPSMSIAAATLVIGYVLVGCSGGGATPTSGLTLPAPSAPDTLFPPENVTDPPIDTSPIPPNAMFGGDVCSALTPADISRVFGARLVDATLLAVDTCRFLVGTGAKQIDVRVQLSTINEFTAPPQRDISDVGPTLPTSPVTQSTTDSDIPDNVQPPDPTNPTNPPPATPVGTGPTTTEVVAGPPPEVEELDGVGLAVRGLQQGRFYEVYVKVDNGFFTVLAPTKADAIALAKLAVPHAKR